MRCPNCDSVPVVIGICPDCEVIERARINALATAMGCSGDEVNPHTLAAAAGVLPSKWHEVTVEKIMTKQNAVKAAVAAAKAQK